MHEPRTTGRAAGGSRGATPTNLHGNMNSSSQTDSRFDCNVCLSEVGDPVVTLCGHLYCWPCLYRWLSTNHTCPVCKAGVTKENVIPLYGRGSEQVDPRTKTRRGGAIGREEATDVPGRPAAQRPEARPEADSFIGGASAFVGGIPFNSFGAAHHYTGGTIGGLGPPGRNSAVSFSAGLGFFPSLFGLQFQTFTPSSSSSVAATQGVGFNGNGNGSTADEAQQAFLSKLLLTLGIFTLGVLVFC